MSESKTYVFQPETGSNALATLMPLLQQKGVDPSVLAMLSNNRSLVVNPLQCLKDNYAILQRSFHAIDATESAVEEFVGVPAIAFSSHSDDSMRTDIIRFAVLSHGAELPYGITASLNIVIIGSQLIKQRLRTVCLQEIVILEGTGVIGLYNKSHDERLLFRVRLRGSLATRDYSKHQTKSDNEFCFHKGMIVCN